MICRERFLLVCIPLPLFHLGITCLITSLAIDCATTGLDWRRHGAFRAGLRFGRLV